MKIIIKIENCETIQAFHAHLHQLQKQIRKQARARKLDPIRDEFKRSDSESFTDFNCYGEHYVTITNERV